MVEKIVVAIDVDGGGATDSGLRWAIDRARDVRATLEVTTIMEPVWAPHGQTIVESATPYAQALERAEESVGTLVPGTTHWGIVRRGNPARVLIALSRHSDLVVLGSQSPGMFVGIIHGTVPLQVAGRAECPVAVIPAEWTPRGTGVVVGWTDDGTADAAVDFAAAEAARRACPLTLVHAWNVPLSVSADPASVILADGILVGQRELLSARAAAVRLKYPDLEVIELMPAGPASVAIVEASRDAELVVVGSHGRGALGGLILGSVSHDVLINMPAPVIVVPRPGDPLTVLAEIVDEDAQ